MTLEHLQNALLACGVWRADIVEYADIKHGHKVVIEISPTCSSKAINVLRDCVPAFLFFEVKKVKKNWIKNRKKGDYRHRIVS